MRATVSLEKMLVSGSEKLSFKRDIPFSMLGPMKLQFPKFFRILQTEEGIVLQALTPSLEVKRYV